MNSLGLPSGEARGAPSGIPAAEALEGLPVSGGPRFEAARVTAVTATTLRAALDLLLGEAPPPRPLPVSWDDGALEVRCIVSQAEALAIAGGLMETIGGSLGQSPGGHPEWVLRVPVQGVHSMYLMLEQGTLALAVPWHSVIRVRMVPREGLAAVARREGAAVLPLFVDVPPATDARPAVLVGLGLKRAYLLADRLIWRMPADPVEPRQPSRTRPFGPAVRTADGEIFQSLDPIELLAQVETVPLPRLASAPVAPRPRVGPVSILRELRREDVEPLGVEPPAAAAAEPTPEPAPGPRARPREKPAAPRALIAEDSIVGSVFLERLLVRRGFAVEVVDCARGLESALARGSWDLVLADVDLSGGGGAEHLRQIGAGGEGRWIALVRDRDDERLAAAAGLTHHLRKPFESDHLDGLLLLLGFGGRAT